MLLWQTSQAIESNGSLSEGRSAGKNLLRLPKGLTCEAKKEDSIELPQSPRTKTTNNLPNQGLLVSSPQGNSRATSPPEKAAVWLVHLEEEDAQ